MTSPSDITSCFCQSWRDMTGKLCTKTGPSHLQFPHHFLVLAARTSSAAMSYILWHKSAIPKQFNTSNQSRSSTTSNQVCLYASSKKFNIVPALHACASEAPRQSVLVGFCQQAQTIYAHFANKQKVHALTRRDQTAPRRCKDWDSLCALRQSLRFRRAEAWNDNCQSGTHRMH